MSHTGEHHLAVDEPLKKKRKRIHGLQKCTTPTFSGDWAEEVHQLGLCQLQWIRMVIQWTNSMRISTEMSQTIPAAQPSSQLYIWMLSLFQRGFFP